MNEQSRILFAAMMICLVSGGLFAVVIYFIGSGKIESFDLPIIEFVQGLETPALTIFFKTFSWIGSAYTVIPSTIIVCAILFFGTNEKKTAILFAFTMVSTIVLNLILKPSFPRERPEIYRLVEVTGLSFPSGHTMMVVGLYGMIVYAAWHHIKKISGRISLILFATVIILFVTMSRIYLGVHFPSDIVGGIAASTCWVMLVLIAFHLFQGNKRG